tara:strand:+ start:269 stop:454 length:186 start_codon:yes stop_codon:yes gene_type:complete
MWHDFLVAIALVLIIEGIAPFLNPEALRKTLLMVADWSDATMRFVGITSMLAGLLILYMVR